VTQSRLGPPPPSASPPPDGPAHRTRAPNVQTWLPLVAPYRHIWSAKETFIEWSTGPRVMRNRSVPARRRRDSRREGPRVSCGFPLSIRYGVPERSPSNHIASHRWRSIASSASCNTAGPATTLFLAAAAPAGFAAEVHYPELDDARPVRPPPGEQPPAPEFQKRREFARKPGIAIVRSR
jgi:hypothetical protein